MKKGIFFDLYGTLIDIITNEYDPWVYATLSRYLAYQGVKIPPNELMKAYSDDIQSQLKQSSETYPEVDVYNIFSNILLQYGNKKYSHSTVIDTSLLFRSLTIRRFELFSGVHDILASLVTHYELAIISDAQRVFTEPEIEMLSLGQFFKYRILSSQFGFKKPDVRLFDMAMKKSMINAEDSIYIGDNPQKDLVGAKRAGMTFILFRSECESYNGFQPDDYFNNYSQLLKILEKM